MPPDPAPGTASHDQGRAAGENAARLADHDRHFARINGSMEKVAGELQALVLAVQRLGDAADADRATVKTTAAALKDADQARRDTTDRHWSPLTRLGVAAGALAALTAVITFVISALHR